MVLFWYSCGTGDVLTNMANPKQQFTVILIQIGCAAEVMKNMAIQTHTLLDLLRCKVYSNMHIG